MDGQSWWCYITPWLQWPSCHLHYPLQSIANYSGDFQHRHLTLWVSYHSALILSVFLSTGLGSSIPQRIVSFYRGKCVSVLAPETQKTYLPTCGLQLHRLQQGLNSSLVNIYSSTFVLSLVLRFCPTVLCMYICLPLQLLSYSTDSKLFILIFPCLNAVWFYILIDNSYFPLENGFSKFYSVM